jgi:hypothetical protein
MSSEKGTSERLLSIDEVALAARGGNDNSETAPNAAQGQRVTAGGDRGGVTAGAVQRGFLKSND